MSYDTTKVNKSGTTYDPADTTHIWADDWNAFVAAYKTHAARHKTGAADAIKLDELASPEDNVLLNVSIAAHGLCPKLPNNTTQYLRADGTWATPAGSGTGDVVGPAGATQDNIVTFDGATGKLIKDSGVAITHAARHENGGADEISVDGLSGLLADAQTPLTHNQAATTITSGELDGDRLPAMSVTKKGGVPATGTPANKFLRDDGTWVTGGTISGNSGATDNAVQRADGTGGSAIQNSLMTIDDSGSANIPAGQTYKINNVTITPSSLSADTTEATTWDTNTTLTNTLNRIRHQIITITGEAWDTVSHSLVDIWAKFHETTGHKHTAAAGDGPQLDHGQLGGLTDDDHTIYTKANGTRAFTGDQSMGTHKITSVTDPAAAQDAATKNYVDAVGQAWAAWTPSLVWSGTSPTGESLSCYWTRAGRVIFFSAYIRYTDSNGSSLTSFTLPSSVSVTAPTYISVSSIEQYDSPLVSINPLAYLTANSNLVRFFNSVAAADGAIIRYIVTGFYITT